jgi:hypothetical protein
MAHPFSASKKMASILAGTALSALCFWTFTSLAPARSAPVVASPLAAEGSPVEPVGYYYRRRHYPPVYPYYYDTGRPGGYSFYFGFIPYARGNYEIQALQREYPQTNWPPSMRYRTPQARDN